MFGWNSSSLVGNWRLNATQLTSHWWNSLCGCLNKIKAITRKMYQFPILSPIHFLYFQWIQFLWYQKIMQTCVALFNLMICRTQHFLYKVKFYYPNYHPSLPFPEKKKTREEGHWEMLSNKWRISTNFFVEPIFMSFDTIKKMIMCHYYHTIPLAQCFHLHLIVVINL